MIGFEDIRNDLLSLSSYDFYKKYILTTDIWYFSKILNINNNDIKNTLTSFQNIISEKLDICELSPQIIGSAKVGFCLSYKKSALSPFREEKNFSDIDVALISSRWFNLFWDKFIQAFRYRYYGQFSYITSNVFNGYIQERNLTSIESLRREWESYFLPITKKLQYELGIIHPVSYRIYRRWEDFERYQIKGIDKLKETMEV
ncbi:MAG: hypothetical protein FWF00_04765 [Endomicrobia bacterium]|nr:hypothetical protein [Endomicrobiia bacterium]